MTDTITGAPLWRALKRPTFFIVALLSAVMATDVPAREMPARSASSAELVRRFDTVRMDILSLANAVGKVLPPLPAAPAADPFMQLTKVGIDGIDLKKTAERLGVDLNLVAGLDLSQINFASIDKAERTCLAQAIYYEARNQKPSGQMAVADVVLNRVASDRYPDTICGVVFQGSERRTGCQFSFTCDGSMDKAVEEDVMFRNEILATAIMGGFRLPLSGEATNYHAAYVDPYWAMTLDQTRTIGDHVFYKRGRNFQVAMAN
ncbi:cell wall hydrolase [Parvularcula sp. LCG005]|uniref:cell wall hydrolase n=1 Tax=Parvularcula sp. LCG005 TaxID=3078805 RepID=UPI00294221BD|nr:cell wall hydrolase [Parvularcula sp. LCG005]WOI52789.1 cell wall hydrolase [Parvularcula sp. LCG005]